MRAVVLASGFLVGVVACGSPQQSGVSLGSIDFPTSGSAGAQASFELGVLYVHSFEYSHAAESFREAQEIDPGFVMAYWGEALTYTHPMWNQQDRDSALVALRKLGATAEERLAKAPTDRERAYLAAVELLYGDGEKAHRDTLFSGAMEQMVEDYPDDHDARAFYALSLLGLSQGDRDIPTYLRAATHALAVFEVNPQHPGAAHYIIHAYDDPDHAARGLEAARAYSKVAPDAPHAQHMTSHIFTAMGMWDDVVAANEHAMAVVERERGRSPVGCGHYNEWLEYGYLQQGRFEDARRLVRECVTEVEEGRRDPGSLADMRAMFLVDTKEWSGDVYATHPDTTRISAIMRFAVDLSDGFAAIGRGDLEAARTLVRGMELRHAGMPAAARGNAKVMTYVLRGAVAFESGNAAEAMVALDSAAALEEELPFAFGPPAAYKPPRELKGEFLLSLGRVEEARKEFELALKRTPRRTATLVGLEQAAE